MSLGFMPLARNKYMLSMDFMINHPRTHYAQDIFNQSREV